jgi:hypothetical protein
MYLATLSIESPYLVEEAYGQEWEPDGLPVRPCLTTLVFDTRLHQSEFLKASTLS